MPRRCGWLAGPGAAALLAASFVLIGVAQAAGPLSWGSPVLVDHQPPRAISAGLTAVSCPSVRLCVGVDDFGDLITSAHPTGSGSSWKLVATKAGSLTGVSCPSARLCVAVGKGGDVLVSKHPRTRAWSIAHVGAGDFGGVSCASASLCVAFQGAQVFVSAEPVDGQHPWRVAYTDSSACATTSGCAEVALRAVSCPSRSFCAAVDDAGNVITSTDPTGGSNAWQIAHVDRFVGLPPSCGPFTGACGQASLLSVSCPSRSLCVATDSAGNVLTSTRPTAGSRAWRAAHVDGPSAPPGYALPGPCKKLSGCAGFITSLSCPSARLCLAADPWGVVFVSRRPTRGASAWRAVQPANSYQLVGISCPSAALCVAVKSRSALVSTRPTDRRAAWRIRRIKTRGLTGLSAVSCPSVSLCVAGDERGHLIASTDPPGGANAWTLQYTQPPPSSGSCVFGECPAVISALSCGVESSCVALSGYTGYYEPPQTALTSGRPAGGASAWTATSSPGLGGLSCPTASLCVSFSIGEVLTTSNPAGGATAWTIQYTEPPSIVQPCQKGGCAGDIRHVSCASATLCVAVNGNGYVLSSTDPAGGPSAWNASEILPGCSSNGSCPGLGGVSCPSTSFCVIGSNVGILTSTSPASGPWNLTPIPGGAPTIFAGSCPSASLCVGVRGNNDLVLSSNPASGPWTTAYVDHGINEPVLTGVTCPSPALCVAIDSSGEVIVGKDTSPR
jgi:hypothetical protein